MTAAPGRPLRFFGFILVAWVAMRVASLGDMPVIHPVPPLRAMASASASVSRPLSDWKPGAKSSSGQPSGHSILPIPNRHAVGGTATAESVDRLGFVHIAAAFANRHPGSRPESLADYPPGAGIVAVPLLTLPEPQMPTADRWAGSAWMLWRPDASMAAGAVPAGRLGGSQAGVRVDYDLAPAMDSRLAAYARVTSALQQPTSPEAALGLAFQPSRSIPVSIGVERRAALGEGGRNATAAMIVGGVGPTPVAPGVTATAYAQAGLVGFERRDGFIDGKASLAMAVAGTPLSLGGAVSGGAQPGVTRLDIGPEARLRLPLPGRSSYLSIEWRQRVAGDARPRSGPALTIGSDF